MNPICKFQEEIRKALEESESLEKGELDFDEEGLLEAIKAKNETLKEKVSEDQIYQIIDSIDSRLAKGKNATVDIAMAKIAKLGDLPVGPKLKQLTQEIIDGADPNIKLSEIEDMVVDSLGVPKLEAGKLEKLRDLASQLGKLDADSEEAMIKRHQIDAEMKSLGGRSWGDIITSAQNIDLLASIPGRGKDLGGTSLNTAFESTINSLGHYFYRKTFGQGKALSRQQIGDSLYGVFNKEFRKEWGAEAKKRFDAPFKHGYSLNRGEAFPLVFKDKGMSIETGYHVIEKITKGAMSAISAFSEPLRINGFLDHMANQGIEVPKFKNYDEARAWMARAEEGKIPDLKPTQFREAVILSEQEALRNVFEHDSLIGGMFDAITRIADQPSAPEWVKGRLKNILLYMRMAGTIAEMNIERSAFGLPLNVVKVLNNMHLEKTGKISKYNAQMAMTRYLSRTLMALGAPTLVGALGSFTGLFVEKPFESRREADGYKGKHYIKLGDYYVDPNWITAIMPTLEMGADLVDIATGRKKDVSGWDFMKRQMFEVPLQAIWDMQIFKSAKSILSAKDTDVFEKGGEFALNTLQTLIPLKSLWGQIARGVSPVARETYDKNPVIRSFNKIRASTIPYGMPVKYDALGKEQASNLIKNAKGLEVATNLINSVFNPFYVRKVENDPVLQGANRLYGVLDKDEKALYKQAYERKLDIVGENGEKKKVELNNKQLSAMGKEVGQSFSKVMGQVLQDPNYTELSPEAKAEVFSAVYLQAHKAAKIKVLGDTINSRSFKRYAMARDLAEGNYETVTYGIQKFIGSASGKDVKKGRLSETDMMDGEED